MSRKIKASKVNNSAYLSWLIFMILMFYWVTRWIYFFSSFSSCQTVCLSSRYLLTSFAFSAVFFMLLEAFPVFREKLSKFVLISLKLLDKSLASSFNNVVCSLRTLLILWKAFDNGCCWLSNTLLIPWRLSDNGFFDFLL